MTRPTNQEMFEWADNPPEQQYLGHATSEEELAKLRDFAAAERRQFLIESCLSEIALRNSLGAPERSVEKPHLDFTDIPLKLTLSLDECTEIASSLNGHLRRLTIYDSRRYWKQLATDYALINGHNYLHSKYSDTIYSGADDQYFDLVQRRAQGIIDRGFDVRFLMDGITHIAEASLDLESVNNLLVQWRGLDRIEQEGFYVPRPSAFWEAMIEEKHLHDAAYLNSYADVVETMGEGVYIAPYIDTSIVRSSEFVSVDDFYKVVRSLGGTLSNSSTGFIKILRALAPSYDGFGKPYQGDQRVMPKGAVFFRRELLPVARDIVGQHGRNEAIISAIDILLGDDHQESLIDEDTRAYRTIVFGE